MLRRLWRSKWTALGLKSHVHLGRKHSSTASVEHIHIPGQGNGRIQLDVCSPSSTNTGIGWPSVVLFLPSGPFSSLEHSSETALTILHDSLQCPIIQINYRLSSDHQYPTPVYDVLAGFDWAKENFLPKRAITRTRRSEHVGKIAVCGELIGGGLAAMLALTECRFGEAGIVAAALHQPVVDWVDLPNTEAANSQLQLLPELLRFRRQLFRKPEHYFDPFASPMLLFRTAGRQIPSPVAELPTNEMDEMQLLSYLSQEEQVLQDQEFATQVEAIAGKPIRKYPKRFPSPSLGLRLPVFRLSTPSDSPIRPQAQEFARRLAQSHARQAPGSFGRKDSADFDSEDTRTTAAVECATSNDARSKVQLVVHDAAANGESKPCRYWLREAATWLREVLR